MPTPYYDKCINIEFLLIELIDLSVFMVDGNSLGHLLILLYCDIIAVIIDRILRNRYAFLLFCCDCHILHIPTEYMQNTFLTICRLIL
jgi:hypothetical protein